MTEWSPPAPDPRADAAPPAQHDATGYGGPPQYAAPPAHQSPYPVAEAAHTVPYLAPAYYPPPAQSAPAVRRSTGRTVLIAAVVAAVVGGGIGAGTVAALDHTGNHSADSAITVSTASAPNSAKIDGSITAAAAKIGPSVVTINVAGTSESGTGSGVILRSDGYILTNNHVVAVAGAAGKIQVITNDGQYAMATVVGIDSSDDLAVVKVSGLNRLVAASFASSAALQVGQSVVAVGAPLSLSNTVTSGIISNIARPVTTSDSSSTTAVFNAIQTDAAINPGNSGGPLVNLNGDVVGIDAAIATADSGGLQLPGQTQQSGSIGIGFAIPSDEAARIAAELISNGKASHAIIGVSVTSTAQNSSIQTVIGATIGTVTADGPAAKAGIKSGDLVTKVQSQQITSGTDLVAAIRSFAPGQTIKLTYLRGGAATTVDVTLGTAGS